MASRGISETQKLKDNLQDQLDRLMAQLVDLDECKEEMDENEYNDLRNETMEQLMEFGTSLKKMTAGDMTLVDDLGAMQLAIQAAISKAFHTPEVIRMFAKKQPGQLRNRLMEIERDSKIGHISKEIHTQQKLEILTALKKLGDTLIPAELEFLQSCTTASLKEFEKITEETGSTSKVLELAGSRIQMSKP